MIGALIGAGASLLGGALSRSSARADARRAEERADPAAIRARYEAAGFNPLRGLGEASANPGLSSYQLSNDILMNSLASAGDGFGEAAVLRMQNTEQERQKERLENLVREATLGASVGGIYDEQPPSVLDRPNPAPGRSADQPSGGGVTVSGGGGNDFSGAPSGGGGSRTPRDLITVADEGEYLADRLDPAEIYNAGRTGRQSFGFDIYPSPGFSDVDEVEARVGDGSELGETVNWISRNAADIGYTLSETVFRPRMVHQPEGRTIPAREAELQWWPWGAGPVYGDFNSYSPGQAIRGQAVHDWP